MMNHRVKKGNRKIKVFITQDDYKVKKTNTDLCYIMILHLPQPDFANW